MYWLKVYGNTLPEKKAGEKLLVFFLDIKFSLA